MISKSLSTSEKFASLHEHAGKMAEFCQSLYPLLVAHADDWGCQQGDTFTIKHLVHPTSPRKLAEFDTALKYLHNAGLITWYQGADGKWVVSIRAFDSHQDLKGHNKTRSRKFDAPPENLSNFAIGGKNPPDSPKPPLSKENLSESNSTYTVGAEEPAPAEWASDPDVDADVPKPQIGAFLKRFCELYSKHRHGAKFMVLRTKHVPLVRNLLTVYDAKRLEKMAVVLLTTDEPWVKETDRGIGILSVKASWLDNLLSEHEAAHGEIQVAS